MRALHFHHRLAVGAVTCIHINYVPVLAPDCQGKKCEAEKTQSTCSDNDSSELHLVTGITSADIPFEFQLKVTVCIHEKTL